MQNAAFINGTTAEAIEAQDGLRFGGNHPVSAVLPVAFVLAESLKRGGKAVVEAVVAGYEAADRPAAAMHPWHTLSGFLPQPAPAAPSARRRPRRSSWGWTRPAC
ncbi:MAG: MmgE/PrpD family protein [Spirochaetota bacterium]